MKSLKKVLAVILAACFVCFSFAACSANKPAEENNDAKETKGTLVMATNAEFPPYEYFENEKIVGIDAEVAQAICNKLGYELKIEHIEFDSIIPGVKGGKFDFGAAGLTVTDERKKEVSFTTSYATGIQSIIVKADSDIKTVDDLSKGGLKIGVQKATTGDLYCTWDIEDEGLGTVERFAKGADAVMALTSGKVDAVVIDNQPAKVFVANNDGLQILDTEYAVEDYAIAVSKDKPELLEEINGALEELIADGTIQNIIDKYIPAE